MQGDDLLNPKAQDPVEFFFDFSSPYSYLASGRIEETCARHGRAVLWRPILLGPIFREIGKLPLLQRPAEGDYARRDLDRWARRLGMPLRFPPVFPVRSVDAARGARFAREAGILGEYCRCVLRACWGEGRDVGNPDVLIEVAAAIGLDAGGFSASIRSEEVKAWLRAETEEARRRGVFGAPTFFVGDEMYYGNDRIFMIDEDLAAARDLGAGRDPQPTPFNEWFGIRCVSRGDGEARYELIVTPSLLNKRGVAHGGAVTSLLDTALGSAVVSAIGSGEWCATLDLSVQFREPVRPGRIIGRGRMVKRGRRAAFAEGDITDAEGKVLAVAHGTWYVWPGRPRD